MAGAIAVGAAKGTLLGAATGSVIGAGVGYAATGTWEGALEGVFIGFGAGAIIGAVAGGMIEYYHAFNSFVSSASPIKAYPHEQLVNPFSLTAQRSHLSPLKYIKNLWQTIKQHGVIKEAIEVNRWGEIIDGHHRVAIAKLLLRNINIVIK